MGDFNPIHLALLKGIVLSSKRKFLNSSSFWIINLCYKPPIEEAEPRHLFNRFSSQEILLDFGIYQSPCTLILHNSSLVGKSNVIAHFFPDDQTLPVAAMSSYY
jgi:hypothetical protein